MLLESEGSDDGGFDRLAIQMASTEPIRQAHVCARQNMRDGTDEAQELMAKLERAAGARSIGRKSALVHLEQAEVFNAHGAEAQASRLRKEGGPGREPAAQQR